MVLLVHGLLLVDLPSEGKEALIEGVVGLVLVLDQIVIEGLTGSNSQ